MYDRHAVLAPPWSGAAGVRVASTTRLGGVSSPPWATLNLGSRTDDDPHAVAANRDRLQATLGLPAEPSWLRQVHGTAAVRAGHAGGHPEADAAWTDERGVVCAVLTADCLPVVLADRSGGCAGVAHAGWRGLAAGVVEATIAALPARPADLRAWLGPAIGPRAFEVGDEVLEAFLESDPGAGAAFRRRIGGRWMANLYLLARRRLCAHGVTAVDGGHWCTHGEPRRFFSHRRDGARTGRMATLVWLEGSGR